MTRLEFKFLKALLYLVAGLVALLLGFTPAKGQAPEPKESIVPMVGAMPFPYAQGYAMRASYLEQIRTQLVKADTLRAQSERAIIALQREIKSATDYQHQLDSLNTHNSDVADSLGRVVSQKQGLLTQAQDSLAAASRLREQTLDVLPKRIRKVLIKAGPDQIIVAFTDHVQTLVWRKWKYLAIGTGVGPLLIVALKAVL
jgi:hypothetical protein